MFNIGDVIIYSVHGLSRIDDICEKTISNVTKTYYVLHPLEEANLTISTPIDNDKVVMLKMVDREEAEKILQSFKEPGADWIDDVRIRYREYQEIIKTGDRREIAKIASTLMRKRIELNHQDKKLYEQDRKILEPIQNILYKELAMSLDSTYEEVAEQVNSLIRE
ncbi:CarD family transcriptional regulator [Bacillus dakarensis]|uniref:CarD family transcriptional regulator n=1 Tax=Robertmurraya dakarensis TaxID=1926278 RepID=UPI0009810E2F|nr:CarD family transcriptional regulator [Bacillus dakarensis]